MKNSFRRAALLLGLAGAGCSAVQANLEERVNQRILIGFKSQCEIRTATVRSLGSAIRAAHVEMRKKEGKSAESSDEVLMDIAETEGEEYRSYSRKVLAFRIRSVSPSAKEEEETPPGPSITDDSHDEAKDQCTITQLHLKRVDVSVLHMGDCPLVEPETAVEALQSDECTTFVERDGIVRLYPTIEGPPVLPRISQEPLAYWLENIGIDRAWKTQTCSKDVVVGVTDTGVAAQHPDLVPNMWRNIYEIENNGIDDDLNGYIDDIHGYDFFSKTGVLTDPHGHGTHVAGIIGANPIVTTVQGVCKTVSIAGLRFMDPQGAGSTSEAIEALNYAIEMDFHMTSNSWGGPEISNGLRQAIERANEVDQLFVAAAGNSANSADDKPEYPAAYQVDNVISVAATDEGDKLSNFSNYGKKSVHIAAPGNFIVSTYPPSGSKSLSGTSMAAPVVAGVAAMVLSVRPMPVKELKEILLSTADRPRTLRDRVISDGRVSAPYAICKATITDPAAKKPAKPSPSKIERLLRKSLFSKRGTL